MIRKGADTGDRRRSAAGFCWRWSDPKDGTLVDDVVIGPFRRPWNAKPDAAKLPPRVPKSNYWATDPQGIGQVGCVYTAQGFEFDYIGVIWGDDWSTGQLEADGSGRRWLHTTVKLRVRARTFHRPRQEHISCASDSRSQRLLRVFHRPRDTRVYARGMVGDGEVA